MHKVKHFVPKQKSKEILKVKKKLLGYIHINPASLVTTQEYLKQLKQNTLRTL